MFVATVLLVSSISSEAHDYNSVAMWSVTIQPSGTLAASFRAPPPGGETDPANTDANRDQALLLDLNDLRGLRTGWTVLIAASEVRGLSLQPGAIQAWQGNPDVLTMEMFSLEPLAHEPALAWMAGAGYGDGLYTLAFDTAYRSGLALPGGRPITLILNLQGVSP
jgi:hypothetical protein